MEKKAPSASFIPEIWQGHKNNGEGAWLALERLENCLRTNMKEKAKNASKKEKDEND